MLTTNHERKLRESHVFEQRLDHHGGGAVSLVELELDLTLLQHCDRNLVLASSRIVVHAKRHGTGDIRGPYLQKAPTMTFGSGPRLLFGRSGTRVGSDPSVV